MSGEEVEEKNGMVTLIVTIDKELLRRVDARLQSDLGAEGVAKVEEGEESSASKGELVK